MNLARNTLFNLIGLGAPLLAALVFVPLLLHALGTQRFGLLALIWALVNYFGLLDLGLGRALTHVVAKQRAAGDSDDWQRPVGTALVLLAGVGLVASVCLVLIAPLVPQILHDLDDPRMATTALRTLALAVPLVVLTAGLRGVLEAYGAFGWVNGLRVPVGLWSFVGPWLACLCWGPDLVLVAVLLVVGRGVGLLGHVIAVRYVSKTWVGRPAWHGAQARELLHVGGWITASNLVSPLIAVLDRFVVGAMLSTGAVSVYATTQELVARLWVVPGALTASLFPMFSAAAGPQAAQSRQRLFAQSLGWLAAAMLPFTAGFALFAPELLTAWLGPELAAQGSLLLQVFAVSAFVNAFAHIPFTLLQGTGAARATALLHGIELPLFLVALWLVLPTAGLAGAAWVWLGRVVLDTAALFLLAHWHPGLLPRGWLTRSHAVQLLGASVAFAAMALTSTEARVAGLLVGVAVTCMPLITARIDPRPRAS